MDRLLFRKLWRDMRTGALSFGAAAAMVALSVALFMAFFGAFLNLRLSCQETYRELRFLDFYLSMRRSNTGWVERVRMIPGVAEAEGRSVVGVRILLGEGPQAEHVRGRAIGMPFPERPRINDVFVEEGRYPQAARGEALLEKRFARERGFPVGSTLTVRAGGRRARFLVTGLVSSPEYIWLVHDRFDPRPNPRQFCVFFLSESDARSLGRANGFNEIHVLVRNPEQVQDVLQEADRRFGDDLETPPVGRADQASNAMLERDQRAFALLAVLFPTIFLAISAVLLASSVWQLLTQQRQQIGVLMSQGFSSHQLFRHYVGYAGAVGILGGAVGGLAGLGLSDYCTRFYTGALGIPFVVSRVHLLPALAAGGAALLIAVVAGSQVVSRLLRLDPAEALRPHVWTRERTFRPEAWLPVLARLGYLFRLPLRNVLRRPLRSVGVVLGIAFAVAQILMTVCLFDSQAATLDFFFREVHRYSLHVDMHPVSPADTPPAEQWNGVTQVERYLRQGSLVVHGNRFIEHGVWGLPPDADLLRLFDADRRRVSPRDVMLSPVLLRRLAARVSNLVRLKLLTGDNREAPTQTYPVQSELYEPVANPVKMTLRTLQNQAAASFSLPANAVNIMLMRVDPDELESIKTRLYSSRTVREVHDATDLRREIADLLRMLDAYKGLMFVFSSLLAVAALAGTTTMNLSERARELATMSILGVGERALALMLVLETLLLWLGGLVVGVPAGWFLGLFLVNHYQSDMIQLTLALEPASAVTTASVSLAICLASVAGGLFRILNLPLASAAQPRVD
ncbi:MAG: ABC transporter permease [Candidatus Eremiobacterota bacterium]